MFVCVCVFGVEHEGHEKCSALSSSGGYQGGSDWVGGGVLLLEGHRAEGLVLLDGSP